MRFKKLGALILGALLTIGVAAGIGATVEKDRVKAAGEPDYSYTFTSKVFTANGTQGLGGVNWTLAGDGNYWGYDGTKGQQFGSKNEPYKSFTLTSESFDNVTKIVINTSGASSVSASFVTTIGDTQVGDSTTLPTNATDYTFTPPSPLTGAVSFVYTQTSEKAIYIKSISVTYGGGSTEPSEPTEKTIKSIVGVATQPEAIYVDQIIDTNKFTFNVTYSDDTTGTVSADNVTIDTSSEGQKTATATFGELTYEFDVTVLADGVESLSWTSRKIEGKKCFEGEMLKNVIDTDKWIFTISFLSGKSEQITGINDTVHVALYDTKSPTTENKQYLAADYTFKADDNGKYLVACYDNYFSSDNQFITVVPKLNSIIQPEIPSDGLVATNSINIGDTVILANRDHLKQLSGISTATSTKFGTGRDYVETPNASEYPLSVQEGYSSGTFALKTEDSKYLTWTSGNSLNVADSVSANSSWIIEFDGDYNAIIKNAADNTRIIKWNNSSPRFACYTSDQDSVQLFKDGNQPAVALHNKNLNAQDLVVQFATYFNKQLVPVCSSENKDFTDAWGNVTSKYNELFGETNDDVEYAKNMMKYATATWEENADCLQRAMKTYEFVVAHHNQTGFMEDIRPVSSTVNSFNVSSLSDNATIIIALVAIVALSGFAFFYVTKRKNKELEF